MMIELEKITNDIEIQKEILSTMPVNTKKNKMAYVEKLEAMKKQYSKLENELIDEITDKYEAEMKKNQGDEKLDELLSQIKNCEKVENVINKYKTPYEKMKLDKSVYNLKRFYKKNLETINLEIRNCIDLFKKVGINLTADDFNFTPYVKQYMEKLFEELNNEEFNPETMKNEFEEIYWKSPNIMTHIRMNIRYIFLKRENQIERFYAEQNGLVKKNNLTKENIIEHYNEYKRLYLEESKKQSGIIIGKFLSGEWNFKDYDEKVINKSYSMFISSEKLNENRDEIDDNLIKLLQNLYEYRNYLKFKYIFDEIRSIKAEAKPEDSYKSIRKQIVDKSNILAVTNKFTKVSQKEKVLQELEDLYEQLDSVKVKEKIQAELNDKSTLKEMVNVVAAFYKFLFICIIKNNKDITEPEIKELIEEIEAFAKSPYNTISQSITMAQDKDIPLMIKDRYNLFDIKISKDDLSEDNIDSLISNLERIENYYYIRKAGLNVSDIELLNKMKKIVTQN